jgi:hypothetical protein
MYSKYNRCCHNPPISTNKLCKPVISFATTMTESERMVKNRCSEYYVKPPSAAKCATDNQPQIVIPATNSTVPYVEVKNVPASATISLNALTTEIDAYDPVNRFRKYFPPPPIPYQCPERIPNNYPKPSTQPCFSVARYQGSQIGEDYIDDY